MIYIYKYMEVLNTICSVVRVDKRKERFETILEPLQAITQLALLSFCPKGSKLSISNNLLYVQSPTWSQGILRSYNQDARDDLYFLFNVIRRFNKFYKSESCAHNPSSTENKLFLKLVELSRIGFDNLIQTYSESDKNALLHTLRMYRTMLDKPEVFYDESSDNKEDPDIKSIDSIFIKITNIYKPYHYKIVYNTILAIIDNPENYEKYIAGLNTIMDPIYGQINKWICDNIVF